MPVEELAAGLGPPPARTQTSIEWSPRNVGHRAAPIFGRTFVRGSVGSCAGVAMSDGVVPAAVGGDQQLPRFICPPTKAWHCPAEGRLSNAHCTSRIPSMSASVTLTVTLRGPLPAAAATRAVCYRCRYRDHSVVDGWGGGGLHSRGGDATMPPKFSTHHVADEGVRFTRGDVVSLVHAAGRVQIIHTRTASTWSRAVGRPPSTRTASCCASTSSSPNAARQRRTRRRRGRLGPTPRRPRTASAATRGAGSPHRPEPAQARYRAR